MREQVSRLAFDLHVCLHNTQIAATVNPSCLIPTRYQSSWAGRVVSPEFSLWRQRINSCRLFYDVHGHAMVRVLIQIHPHTHATKSKRKKIWKNRFTSAGVLPQHLQEGCHDWDRKHPSEQSVATSLGWEPRSTPWAPWSRCSWSLCYHLAFENCKPIQCPHLHTSHSQLTWLWELRTERLRVRRQKCVRSGRWHWGYC